PEQAEMSGLDIDTRSDIYSLGVLLYELLTGRPPFDSKALIEKGVEEARRTIREIEPARPSTRLNTLGKDELTTIARQRAADAPKLVSSIRGDLDWIVMKCLEKDRTRRYETANGLAMDVKRFLNQELILARPPSRIYQLQKLVRRHKAAFAAAAMVVAALLAGLAGTTWSFLRERAARSEANARRIDAERARIAEGHERQRAQAAVTRLEIDRAEMLFAAGQSAEALAYLARVLRREPTNRVAGERIISALAHRNFCVPLFRLEHKGTASAAEFSPDGRRVVTASSDGTARIWDGLTGKPLLGPFQHADQVTAACFGRNGERLVTASLDKTVKIWDTHTGKLICEPLRHETGVLSADFSPDGQQVVTGSADGSVRIWNVATAAPRGPAVSLNGAVNFVEFSPDGKLALLASRQGGTGRLVNAADGKELGAFTQVRNLDASATLPYPSFSADGTRVVTVPGAFVNVIWIASPHTNRMVGSQHASAILCARFSPDGQYIATTSLDTTARIWVAGTNEPIGEVMRHENYVNSVEFSPDGRQVVTSSKDHTAQIWDARTGSPVCEPLRHDANVFSAQFSSDGQRILSLCEGGSVWVWEIRCGHPVVASLRHPDGLRRAVFSPLGDRLATTCEDGRVRLWDAIRAESLGSPLPGSGYWDLQFGSDGRLLAGANNRGANVWDTIAGKVVGGPFSNTNSVQIARFSPDGQLVVTAGYRPQARVWRIASGSVVSELPHDDLVRFAQFSPNGQWVITASEDKTARLWDWRTSKPLTGPLAHEGAVVWADVSADSKRAVTVSRDQTARIWEAPSGKLLHSLYHAEEPYQFNSVQFSLDGRLIVTSAGNAAQIWDAFTGQPVTAPLKHNGRVESVRFSPDGKRVITACNDSNARVWDAASGHLLGEPLRHRTRVYYAEFSPDDRWVVTASTDGTARIWEVPRLSSSVPPWLAVWAEAVAGQRLDERSANQPVPFDELRDLRERRERGAESDQAAHWARWFFAQNSARAISPASAIAVEELVQRRIQEGTLESLQQAVRLSPTNALARARLAFTTLTNDAAPNARQMASSDWQSLRASRLAPADPEVLLARAEVCERLGRLSEALEIMERAANLNATNAPFWNGWGLLLEKTNRVDDALQAYAKAAQLSASLPRGGTFPAVAWRNRSSLLRRLGRLPEASADNLKARGLSERQPDTPPHLIDLSLYYNRGLDRLGPFRDYSGIPTGRVTLEGIEFDLRGPIQLKGGGGLQSILLPESMPGIVIQQKCRRLHFLHVAASAGAVDGLTIGRYRMRYVDSQEVTMPIIYGRHLRTMGTEWDPKTELASGTRVGWTGTTPDNHPIRLFITAWENPRPEIAVESLDFVSSVSGVIPHLFAITAEP
ncbi:MAG: hypothetical protein L0Y58_15845, partial [Verrucomicrobia subdivision 3 bacterium]|nr:hypothetical protein [Limisphaerales bacterium]